MSELLQQGIIQVKQGDYQTAIAFPSLHIKCDLVGEFRRYTKYIMYKQLYKLILGMKLKVVIILR